MAKHHTCAQLIVDYSLQSSILQKELMKIFLIGGTGKTGREIIKQGLERGHQITVLVRSPKRLKMENPDLSIIRGNVLVPESYQHIIGAHEVVISALGHKRFIIPSRILSRGTKALIDAMNSNRVQRLICITALGVNDSRYRLGLYYTLFTIPVILFFYFLDKSRQEKIIMNSNLDWTIVRPGQLTNGKKRPNYKHGPHLGSYILTKMISRASVADFILNQVEHSTYSRNTVGLTN